MCRCAINPPSMQSGKYKIVPTKHPKRIAIIGGGIGGMEAARVLKLRGHYPTIYEKSGELGGIFIAAAAPSFKENDKKLIEWFKLQMKELDIPVKLNTEVKDLNSLLADEIIIATGTTPKKIPIPGAERAMDATEYLLGEKEVGDNVVIIGGGLTGCEITLDLFRKGKHPAIVEMMNDLMAVPNLCLANSSYLRDCFKTNNIPVFLEAKTKEIGPDYVLVEGKDKRLTKVPADSVIFSVGYRPAPLVAEGKNVHLIGDCKKVGNLRSAIWGAWDVAMKL